MKKSLVVVRGGGDLATGTIHRLWKAGFPVVVLEAERPAAIRRQVSACEAVYEGTVKVEDMVVRAVKTIQEAEKVIQEKKVPIMVDPKGAIIWKCRPEILVDGILAKKNLGTTKEMAPLTIALGPGFEAGKDVDYVIETMRGHNLGRILSSGSAFPNTGIPGNIGGYTSQRVIYGAVAGVFRNVAAIGDVVEQGDRIAEIVDVNGKAYPVEAAIGGIIRGLLRDGYPVPKGFKIADIDPRRDELKNCFTISDKARCISGSVLELCVAHS